MAHVLLTLVFLVLAHHVLIGQTLLDMGQLHLRFSRFIERRILFRLRQRSLATFGLFRSISRIVGDQVVSLLIAAVGPY